MNLIISLSARKGGNCDSIAEFIKRDGDRMLALRDLSVHQCMNCEYECMSGVCKYREDDVYKLFATMKEYSKVIVIVPMYCGNPSSLYFLLNERSQDYFMHNDDYGQIVKKLYFIGVYGDRARNPDYLNHFEKWFDCVGESGHVLGIERHRYGQRLKDSVLDVEEVKKMLKEFCR